MLKNPKAKKGLIVVVILAVAYFIVLPRFRGSAAEVTLPEHPNPGPTYTLEASVYNLLTPASQPPRFIKLGVVFEFATADKNFFLLTGAALQAALATFAAELAPKAPVIEDAVNAIVSSKVLQDVSTPLGRDQLKQEIKSRVAEIVGEPELLNVYFTDLVTQ